MFDEKKTIYSQRLKRLLVSGEFREYFRLEAHVNGTGRCRVIWWDMRLRVNFSKSNASGMSCYADVRAQAAGCMLIARIVCWCCYHRESQGTIRGLCCSANTAARVTQWVSTWLKQLQKSGYIMSTLKCRLLRLVRSSRTRQYSNI